MPVTKEQAQRLTSHVIDCRPTSAPKWDAAGVMAAISKVAQLGLADVSMAAIRAAADRSLQTPAAIGDTSSSAWRERVSERTAPQNPKPHEACRDCGNHVDRCVCPDGPTTRPQPAADGTEQANQIRTQLGWRREVEL